MSHILIILTSKNHFPTHIRQYCKDELCMGNLQGHWTCRSSVFAQMCFKSCGNCLTATAGIGGRAKPRNVVPYCRLASGTGEVTSGRAGASHLLQSSQLLEIRHGNLLELFMFLQCLKAPAGINTPLSSLLLFKR